MFLQPERAGKPAQGLEEAGKKCTLLDLGSSKYNCGEDLKVGLQKADRKEKKDEANACTPKEEKEQKMEGATVLHLR